MNWYLKVLNQYLDFNGRARRQEYWMFILFHIIFLILAMVIDNVLSISFSGTPYGYIYLLYSLLLFIPSLAVSIRRLHDIGKSGWWILIGIIPLIGSIVLLVFACQDSEQGKNQWGDNPKGIGNGSAIDSIGSE